jgi:lactoylglutathione lyase
MARLRRVILNAVVGCGFRLFSSRRTAAMNLNHLNLTVTDPVETQRFLAKHFGLKPMGKANDTISFLTDDNGMVLSLTNARLGKESEVKYPATFHIGFIQDSKERVNEINRVLKADGFDVPPPSKQHGSWTFYFVAPGGFTIEVLC